MQMVLYADSKYPVREDVDAIHAKQLDQIGKPGTWGTAAQRLAIAQEVRDASFEVGLQERPEKAQQKNNAKLPSVAQEVVRNLTVSPKDFLESSYNKAKKMGLVMKNTLKLLELCHALHVWMFLPGASGSP